MRDRDWLIPVAVIVAVQLLLWRAAYAAGIAYPPMFVAYGLVAYAFFVAVAGCKLFAITIGMAKYREPEPTRKLLEVMRSNWPRAIAALVGLQLVALGSAAFSAIKGAMPKAAPFWLDTPLMNVEASAGVHPWQVSHFLFGWATPLIDRLYATFVPVHMLAVFAVLATRPSAHKSRALVTLALSWLVVGICGAWALSSAGPIFYDRAFGGETFAGLIAALHDAPVTVLTADALWASHASDIAMVANGISAMPSMHVALTLWLCLVVGKSRFAPLAWSYFALIWLGSIHLGWHYATDGLVGSIAVWALWSIAPKLTYHAGRPTILTANQFLIEHCPCLFDRVKLSGKK